MSNLWNMLLFLYNRTITKPSFLYSNKQKHTNNLKHVSNTESIFYDTKNSFFKPKRTTKILSKARQIVPSKTIRAFFQKNNPLPTLFSIYMSLRHFHFFWLKRFLRKRLFLKQRRLSHLIMYSITTFKKPWNGFAGSPRSS